MHYRILNNEIVSENLQTKWAFIIIESVINWRLLIELLIRIFYFLKRVVKLKIIKNLYLGIIEIAFYFIFNNEDFK